MTEWNPLLEPNELLRCFREAASGAVRIRIASAFVSPFAAQQVLGSSERGSRPTVVVGRELSKHQVEGLELLGKHCDVRVWIGGPSFHPKLYLLEGAEFTRVIIGSSNFTAGGFSTNIEANVFADLPAGHPVLTSIVARFEQWQRNSVVLTDEWLRALREAAEVADVAQGLVAEDAQAERAHTRIQSLIADEHAKREAEEAKARARAASARPFFRPEHFAAFVPAKHRSEDASVVRERKAVSQRLLELHEKLLPRIRAARWDLHPHHSSQHTTSSWHLVPKYVSHISGMWLSYGRQHERFKELKDYQADEVNGFFNFAKLQVLIDERRLRFGLMLAQRNNEWDRHYLKQKLGLVQSPLVTEPERVVEVLRAAGVSETAAYLERESHDIEDDWERIALRDLNTDALLDIARRDQRGHWLGTWVDFAPGDAAVSEGAIVDTTMRVFELLYPAFELLAWFPRKP